MNVELEGGYKSLTTVTLADDGHQAMILFHHQHLASLREIPRDKFVEIYTARDSRPRSISSVPCNLVRTGCEMIVDQCLDHLTD